MQGMEEILVNISKYRRLCATGHFVRLTSQSAGEVDDKSSVVWGRRVGSRLTRLPRLLDEDPMGKPVAHPQKMATASQWLAIGPSAHPQTEVAEEICGGDLK